MVAVRLVLNSRGLTYRPNENNIHRVSDANQACAVVIKVSLLNHRYRRVMIVHLVIRHPRCLISWDY